MASVVNWLKRNRRKIAVGGAVVGGLYVLGKVAENQYLKYKHQENLKLLEKLRKENHFCSTENNCVTTLSSLFPLLRKKIEECLDTDSITDTLRENKEMSNKEKIEMWEELKVVSVSRCVVLVVAGVYLSLMVRIQLNILAGYIYKHQMGVQQVNNNIKNGIVSHLVQEAYLSICNNFVSSGISSLCQATQVVVKKRLNTVQLQQKLTVSELEAVLTDVLTQLKGVEECSNIFTNTGVYFLPSTDDFLANLDSCDKDDIKEILAETLDIIESEDLLETVGKLIKQGLTHVCDTVGEEFGHVDVKQLPQKSKDDLHDSGFVSPASVSLPLAKIIPMLSSQVSMSHEEDDVWLWHLTENPLSKSLGANIYESYSQTEQKTETESQGWTSWFYSTVDQFLGFK